MVVKSIIGLGILGGGAILFFSQRDKLRAFAKTDEQKEAEKIEKDETKRRDDNGALKNTCEFFKGKGNCETDEMIKQNDEGKDTSEPIEEGFFSPAKTKERDDKGFFQNTYDFFLGDGSFKKDQALQNTKKTNDANKAKETAKNSDPSSKIDTSMPPQDNNNEFAGNTAENNLNAVLPPADKVDTLETDTTVMQEQQTVVIGGGKRRGKRVRR